MHNQIKTKINNLLIPTKLDLTKHLYSFVVFLFSLFVLYSYQLADLSNHLLRGFDSFSLSFPDKVTAGTQNFLSLLVLSAPPAGKTILCPFKF